MLLFFSLHIGTIYHTVADERVSLLDKKALLQFILTTLWPIYERKTKILFVFIHFLWSIGFSPVEQKNGIEMSVINSNDVMLFKTLFELVESILIAHNK